MGGVSSRRATDLKASSEALTTFVKRVDAILTDLEQSAGSPTRVGAQTINAGSLNSGSMAAFPEAQGLYSQYQRVHQELTALSKILHLQIEAIGIAVRGAYVGFENLEEEQRQRFHAIQTQIRETQDAKDLASNGAERTNEARTSGGL
ncbi:DUF2563 family protein [Streptomyces sp. bgisy154]|uniref:DUF2563 family protein n=1 Tax=Streptomyces sp. bgisy154 TaxID=3413794 RepID=UPI003D712BD4